MSSQEISTSEEPFGYKLPRTTLVERGDNEAPLRVGESILESREEPVSTDLVVPNDLVVTELRIDEPRGRFQRKRASEPDVVIPTPKRGDVRTVRDVLAGMSPMGVGFKIGREVQDGDSMRVENIMTVYTDPVVINGIVTAFSADGRSKSFPSNGTDRSVYPSPLERPRTIDRIGGTSRRQNFLRNRLAA